MLLSAMLPALASDPDMECLPPCDLSPSSTYPGHCQLLLMSKHTDLACIYETVVPHLAYSQVNVAAASSGDFLQHELFTGNKSLLCFGISLPSMEQDHTVSPSFPEAVHVAIDCADLPLAMPRFVLHAASTAPVAIGTVSPKSKPPP